MLGDNHSWWRVGVTKKSKCVVFFLFAANNGEGGGCGVCCCDCGGVVPCDECYGKECGLNFEAECFVVCGGCGGVCGCRGDGDRDGGGVGGAGIDCCCEDDGGRECHRLSLEYTTHAATRNVEYAMPYGSYRTMESGQTSPFMLL